MKALYILPLAAIVAGFAGLTLMLKKPEPSSSTGALPDKLSTDPAKALAELAAVFGAPSTTVKQQKGPSGRVYDATFWKPKTSPKLPGALFISGTSPAPVLYVMTYDERGEIKVLTSIVPDDVAKSDIAKIQHSI